MLYFNPDNRLSASECLQSNVFDNIRSLDIEKPSPKKVTVNLNIQCQQDAVDALIEEINTLRNQSKK
jgi:hypothetical protein